MKPIFAAVALLIATVGTAGAAGAQVSAGSVPNTFDRPAQPAVPRVQASPAQQPATPVAATAPTNPAAESTLRTLIAGAQAGGMDYSLMSDDLAARVREREAVINPLLQGFGVVVAVDFVGSQNGADLFAVTFASEATEWVIGFNDAGKVAALLFRPAQ